MARRSPKRRSVVVGVLVVLGCLSVMVSSVSIWAHRTIFNTDRWVATVGPLAQNPAVIGALSTRLTSELDQLVEPEQRLAHVLPTGLQGLAAPLAQGVDQLLEAAVTGILHSEQFQRFWVATNRAVQPVVAAVLLGRPTQHLLTAGGTIQLNLLPLVAKGLNFVHQRAPAFLPTKSPIPVITPSTPVDQARSELSRALGRPLSPGFGTITLFHSSQLASAQRLVRVFNALIVALVVVTAIVLVSAVVISARRRRTVIVVALGIAGAMGLAFALTKVITNEVVHAVVSPGNLAAVRATVGAVLDRLDTLSALLILISLLVAAGALFFGPGAAASSLRRRAAAGGRALVGRTAMPPPAALRWTAAHRAALAWVGLVPAVLVLLFVVEGWIGLLLCLGLLALYEAILVWVGRRAAPGAP